MELHSPWLLNSCLFSCNCRTSCKSTWAIFNNNTRQRVQVPVWIQTSWVVLIFWAAPFSAQSRSNLHSVNKSSLLLCSTGLACFTIWLLITKWKSEPVKSSCEILYYILWNKTPSNCSVNQFDFFSAAWSPVPSLFHVLILWLTSLCDDRMLICIQNELPENINTWV